MIPRGYLASMLRLAARASAHLEGLTTYQRRALEILAATPVSHDNGWMTGPELFAALGKAQPNMVELEGLGYVMNTQDGKDQVYKITPRGISYLARVERNEEHDEILQRYWRLQSQAGEVA